MMYSLNVENKNLWTTPKGTGLPREANILYFGAFGHISRNCASTSKVRCGLVYQKNFILFFYFSRQSFTGSSYITLVFGLCIQQVCFSLLYAVDRSISSYYFFCQKSVGFLQCNVGKRSVTGQAGPLL